MNRWLVTGLPRSRTAWWAVVTGARHEPISQQGIGVFGPKWLAQRGGVSDSGAALHLRDILAGLKPKTLIVERAKSAVVASLAAYVGQKVFLDWNRLDGLLDEALRQLVQEHPLIKRVQFADLDSIGTVADCLDWLEVPAPSNLAELMHMRVQSDLAFNLTLLNQRAA